MAMELTAIERGRTILGTSIGPMAELAGALKARKAPRKADSANRPQIGGWDSSE